MKNVFLIFIISSISFAGGEISFKKQREKEAQGKIERNQENKEIKVIKRNNNLVRNKIVEEAKKKLGSPYLWGATGPNSFDCSGFVGYVFRKAADLNLPRVSSEQATFRPKISSMNMKKGDLVFFETTGKGRISHVGIYMGGRQFIHASSGSRRVTISSLDSDFYSRTFRWAINPFS